jgi:hypothetical protein
MTALHWHERVSVCDLERPLNVQAEVWVRGDIESKYNRAEHDAVCQRTV